MPQNLRYLILLHNYGVTCTQVYYLICLSALMNVLLSFELIQFRVQIGQFREAEQATRDAAA